jgi:hypothetical protein
MVAKVILCRSAERSTEITPKLVEGDFCGSLSAHTELVEPLFKERPGPPSALVLGDAPVPQGRKVAMADGSSSEGGPIPV